MMNVLITSVALMFYAGVAVYLYKAFDYKQITFKGAVIIFSVLHTIMTIALYPSGTVHEYQKVTTVEAIGRPGFAAPPMNIMPCYRGFGELSRSSKCQTDR